MGRDRKAQADIPEEASQPDPEQTPHVSRGEKGESSSRVDQSQEPAENEEKRRVARKLEEREKDR